ncbi:N(2)-acetyl-L-2,4-diaminobutanoate deacetylase DoeB [Rhodoferax sp. PAMC 29310]|uniref:N(2)-acetyl-L-2,4-diaminobutanoate deacetylase DoeB n=1 Tax=Rhodoferax sp. PAMC 29310 TaxID=2822760 RepID=UPI001B34089E|nr:N(2)-acetyl-L-2,4-diaminobutanoate deacetylase DoeB [Rhodoferax sp. PAMC 29310]
MLNSPITTTVDYSKDGIQHGFLKLPYSRDDSAWGALMIPITVAQRGIGPTVLLTGANHGDEYEGPVALIKLANAIKAEDVKGRVIILPYMNYPAFRAGQRTSPIDKGNLNRSFPGSANGTPTQKIADYVQRHLLPLADYTLDIHSGGRTLDFLPFAAVHVLDDKAQQARCELAMRAFAAPYSMTMLELDSAGMLDSAAEAMGKVFVSTELGGGGSASAKTIAIADRGVQRFLVHAGVYTGALSPVETVMLDMPDSSCFITCLDDGLLEMCKDLGDMIVAGELLARVHDVTRTGVSAIEYRASRNGVLASRHFPGLIACGDTLAVIADVLH